MSAPFRRQELDGFDPAVSPYPAPSVVSAAQLARARELRALRDWERGRRRYRSAYQRLLRRERDPVARKAAHVVLLGQLRRVEEALDAAMRGVEEAEAREAQEALAVRARLEGWP